MTSQCDFESQILHCRSNFFLPLHLSHSSPHVRSSTKPVPNRAPLVNFANTLRNSRLGGGALSGLSPSSVGPLVSSSVVLSAWPMARRSRRSRRSGIAKSSLSPSIWMSSFSLFGRLIVTVGEPDHASTKPAPCARTSYGLREPGEWMTDASVVGLERAQEPCVAGRTFAVQMERSVEIPLDAPVKDESHLVPKADSL